MKENENQNLPEGVVEIPIYLMPDTVVRHFGRNQENRKINKKHVNKIKKDWERSAEYIPPITINFTTKNIIDGQHRLQAFLELIDEGVLKGGVDGDKILVRFIKVEPEEEKQLIIDANTKSKNWNQSDYIESYQTTNDDYKRLYDWCVNHPLCVDEKGNPKPRYGAAIIKSKGCGGLLKKGKFSVTEEEWNEAEQTYEEIGTIIEILGLETKGAYIEALATAWGKYKSYAPLKQWFSMMKKEKNNIIKMPYANKKNWLTIFDYVYSRIARKLADKGKIEVVDENGKEIKD